MADNDEVVSKGDFAKLCGVSPGRVTQWIDEGKISGAALVGEGRSAKIRVSVARRQVNLRRDVGQALGNGLSTKLKPEASKPPEVLYDQEPDDHSGDGTDDVDRKLKLAKLETVERTNRMAAAEELATQGFYTETASARAEMGKIAVQVIRVFEGAVPELATTIAAEFKLQTRDVTHHLNKQFRKLREKAAEAAAREAQLVPETVET